MYFGEDLVEEIKQSRRNHPVEIGELRVIFDRSYNHKIYHEIRILSAPIDAYQVGKDEDIVPIMPLWEPVIAELRKAQRKRLREKLKRALAPPDPRMMAFRNMLPVKFRAPQEYAGELRKAIKTPKIYFSAPYYLYRSTHVCGACGKKFFCPMVSHQYTYCSKACEAHSPARKAAIAERVLKISAERTAKRAGTACAHCGKAFAPRRSSAKFCSSLCRVKSHYHAKAGRQN